MLARREGACQNGATMKARLAIAAFVVALASTPPVAAQDAGALSAEIRWERPPAGSMERGALSASEGVVVALGTIVIAGAVLGLVAAAMRARRRAR